MDIRSNLVSFPRRRRSLRLVIDPPAGAPPAPGGSVAALVVLRGTADATTQVVPPGPQPEAA